MIKVVVSLLKNYFPISQPVNNFSQITSEKMALYLPLGTLHFLNTVVAPQCSKSQKQNLLSLKETSVTTLPSHSALKNSLENSLKATLGTYLEQVCRGYFYH